jgi:hypothetical protein
MTLAVLGGGPVVATGEPGVVTDPEHVWVEQVSIDRPYLGEPADVSEGDGYISVRGMDYRCELVTSDPRVSGTITGGYNDDCRAEAPCIKWGDEELAGPDGGWVGSWQGTIDAEGTHTDYKVMSGTGACEGLTCVWHASGATAFGLIHAGASAPPPMPAASSTE